MAWPFSKKPKPVNLDAEVDRIFRKVVNFLNDEPAQNEKLPAEFRETLSSNGGCDYIEGGAGAFGRAQNNPIPVNGPIGEVLYLSNICTPKGIPITFHRLGSVDQVDAYEIISIDGRHWDVIFLSCYYTRKSRADPNGYRKISQTDRTFRGTNEYLMSFPEGIYDATGTCARNLVGFPVFDTALKAVEKIQPIARTGYHLALISDIVASDGGKIFTTHRADHLGLVFDAVFSFAEREIAVAANKIEERLSPRFSSELTFLILYMFTAILFQNDREDNLSALADRLVRQRLKILANRTGDQLEGLVSEYRNRFGGYRQIGLFVGGDLEEANFAVSQALKGSPGIMFGALVGNFMQGAMEGFRELIFGPSRK